MGLRPVFKGGWSLDVEHAGRLRGLVDGKRWQTPAFLYLREDKLGAPIVDGFPTDKSIHQIHLSRDAHATSKEGRPIQQKIRLTILPPTVGRSSIKRSGVLDHLTGSKEQTSLLKEAAQPCDVSEDAKFPDPWAKELEIEVGLFGTSSISDSAKLGAKDAKLHRGETKVFQLPWSAGSRWPRFDKVFLEIAAGVITSARQSGKTVFLEIAPGDRLNVSLRVVIAGRRGFNR